MADERDMRREQPGDESGSHPVGTGLGAAGGAVAGAAAGIVGGPIGMAVGGVVGAVVGGLAGNAAAEAVNPTEEEAYWRDNYEREPYYQTGRNFDDYGPAYRHGLEARNRYDDWNVAEPYMASEWESKRGGSSLDWQSAQPATRAAWDRVDPHYREGISEYGTGLASTDSTYRTGGPGNTASDRATGLGDSNLREDTTHLQSTGMGTSNLGAGTTGGMGATSTMTGGTLGATSGMDAGYTAGTWSSHDAGQSNMARSDAAIGSGTGYGEVARPSGTAGTSAAAGVAGAAAAVGAAQQSGNASGDRQDTIDVLQELVETCKDGEYGFQQCADHAKREDLRAMFRQRADDCRRGASQLQEHIRQLGGHVPDSGSAMGAVHRGWVATRAAMTSYDDKAMLEEAERGEDNALARYRKALEKPLPENVRQVVQHQCDGVQRNHDEVKRLRNEARAQG